MRRVLKIASATAAVGLGMAAPTNAAIVTQVGPTTTASSCLNFSFSVPPTEISCAGGYSGNLFQGTLQSPGADAVSALGYTGSGAYLANIFNSSGFGSNGTTIDFGTTLYGLTVIGIHYGGARDPGGEATSFFSFDAGTTGISSINVTGRDGATVPFGLSSAALFSTSLPEPATWGMMLLGFAGIGFAMRRSRQGGALMQVA